MGYAPNGGNWYTGSDACNNQYFTDPEVFESWQPIGGHYHCRLIRSVPTSPGGTNYSMSVYWNGGTTNSWTFSPWFAGNPYPTLANNFYSGTAFTNGERHDTTYDSAATHYLYLDEKTVQNPNTWVSFGISYQLLDTDPSYQWCAYSGDYTKVYLTGTTAC